MRMLTGALLLLGAEQAYAHANLVQFPNHVEARTVLLPAAISMLAIGLILLVWGLLTDHRSTSGATGPGKSA